jgi:hypothetical protein
LDLFLNKKGWDNGAGSKAYTNSDLFLEKFRILKKERKTNKRVKNEKLHPAGFELHEHRYTWVRKSGFPLVC